MSQHRDWDWDGGGDTRTWGVTDRPGGWHTELGITRCLPPPPLFTQSAVKESAAEEELTPMALARQLEGLKQQLVSCHLQKLLGPTAAIDFADPEGALAK